MHRNYFKAHNLTDKIVVDRIKLEVTINKVILIIWYLKVHDDYNTQKDEYLAICMSIS